MRSGAGEPIVVAGPHRARRARTESAGVGELPGSAWRSSDSTTETRHALEHDHRGSLARGPATLRSSATRRRPQPRSRPRPEPARGARTRAQSHSRPRPKPHPTPQIVRPTGPDPKERRRATRARVLAAPCPRSESRALRVLVGPRPVGRRHAHPAPGRGARWAIACTWRSTASRARSRCSCGARSARCDGARGLMIRFEPLDARFAGAARAARGAACPRWSRCTTPRPRRWARCSARSSTEQGGRLVRVGRRAASRRRAKPIRLASQTAAPAHESGLDARTHQSVVDRTFP